MKMIANGEEIDVTNAAHLLRIINELNGITYVEIWMNGLNDGEGLSALINRERVLYMALINESCIVSFDPSEVNGTDIEEFYLSNGQLDQYPKYKTVPRESLSEVLLYYHDHREVSKGVEWEKEY